MSLYDLEGLNKNGLSLSEKPFGLYYYLGVNLIFLDDFTVNQYLVHITYRISAFVKFSLFSVA